MHFCVHRSLRNAESHANETQVAWGLIATRIVWPISARRKFKDGLSLLWLRMGLIWKRDPLSTLLEGESSNNYMNLREEFALQRYVSLLPPDQCPAQSILLLVQTVNSQHAPRLYASKLFNLLQAASSNSEDLFLTLASAVS